MPTSLLATRAERFREREEQQRRLVTDYHHAAAQARKIRTDAQKRAAKITADAEKRIAALHERADKEASVFDDEASAAVRAILRFGEPRKSVASLTGLTTTQVRTIERRQRAAATPSGSSTEQPDNEARTQLKRQVRG